MAKKPEQLISEFKSLLGAHTCARVVWQVEGADGRKPNFDRGVPNSLKVLDSADGIVRELVPKTDGSHFSAASFTWDGKRITFTDNDQRKIYVIDFDGKNKRCIAEGFDGDGHCFATPDGKQWVFASEAKDALDAPSSLYQINIDNPSEKIEIVKVTWARPEWAGSTCWASMSPDGKYMAGGFPNYNDLGIMEVASKSITKFAINGCWPTIARDGSYDVLYTNGDIEAHQQIRIVDKHDKELLRTSLVPKVLDPDCFHESLRWMPQRDYLTMSVYKEGFFAKGLPQPRIVRLSDMNYVAINDSPISAEGNTDVFLYDV